MVSFCMPIDIVPNPDEAVKILKPFLESGTFTRVRYNEWSGIVNSKVPIENLIFVWSDSHESFIVKGNIQTIYYIEDFFNRKFQHRKWYGLSMASIPISFRMASDPKKVAQLLEPFLEARQTFIQFKYNEWYGIVNSTEPKESLIFFWSNSHESFVVKGTLQTIYRIDKIVLKN
jgi:hypothetical protein